MQFNLESEIIEVRSGGSVYDSAVGSYNYTDWMYWIGLDGRDDYDNSYDFSILLGLVYSNSKLSIDKPEDYLGIYEDNNG